MIEDKIQQFMDTREEVKKLYVKQKELEQEIIQHFIDNKNDFSSIKNGNYILSLKWVYDKIIDYEKLEAEYPEIYILGLRPEFSKLHLLKVIDKKQVELIIRECTLNTSRYKLDVKWDRSKYKDQKKGEVNVDEPKNDN